jgi:hypothetical protein
LAMPEAIAFLTPGVAYCIGDDSVVARGAFVAPPGVPTPDPTNCVVNWVAGTASWEPFPIALTVASVVAEETRRGGRANMSTKRPRVVLVVFSSSSEEEEDDASSWFRVPVYLPTSLPVTKPSRLPDFRLSRNVGTVPDRPTERIAARFLSSRVCAARVSIEPVWSGNNDGDAAMTKPQGESSVLPLFPETASDRNDARGVGIAAREARTIQMQSTEEICRSWHRLRLFAHTPSNETTIHERIKTRRKLFLLQRYARGGGHPSLPVPTAVTATRALLVV